MHARSAHIIRPALILFIALISVQAASGQFWEKKPYQKWSKDEAQKMVSDSPWAREVNLSNITASSINTNVSGRTAQGGNEQAGAMVTYQVQLRSAQPVRAAVVRLAQFNPRYEQMSPEQKQRVDANADNFIRSRPDDIVFWVNYSCTVPNHNDELNRYWQTQAIASLVNTLWLQVPGAEKIAATYFAPGPNQSFELHFPRPKDVPADGSFVLEFRHPAGVAGQKGQRVLAEFKLKKIAISGAAVY